MGMIHYIAHQNIDQKKWDACIRQSPQGLIYAYAWYLNCMSPQWDALVWGDYDAVMPLTRRKKWGIHYLYQPAFCAELGVFSKKEMNADTVRLFLQNIPVRYRYIDICLNRNNVNECKGYPFSLRNNYVLSLGASYTEISQRYSDNHIRNIKKANRNDLFFDLELNFYEALTLLKSFHDINSNYSKNDWICFEKLYQEAFSKQVVCCTGVRDVKGDLLSTAVFFYAHHTWFYIMAAGSKEGKALGASHFLVDQFIRLHAGTNTYIDIEGSDVDSVAFFYKGFGAENMPYPSMLINRLPVWLRWIKG